MSHGPGRGRSQEFQPGAFRENFDLLIDTGLYAHCCATWVAHPDAREVARRFGADPRTAMRSTYRDASVALWEEPSPSEVPMLVCGASGGGTLAVEPLGYHGSLREVLEAVTADGLQAVNLYWDVNSARILTWARNGEVVTLLNSDGPELRGGTDPAALDSAAADLPLYPPTPEEEAMGALLELVFRLCGHRWNAEWFRTRPHSRYLIR